MVLTSGPIYPFDISAASAVFVLATGSSPAALDPRAWQGWKRISMAAEQGG